MADPATREEYLAKKARLLGLELTSAECEALAELGRRQEDAAIGMVLHIRSAVPAPVSSTAKIRAAVCRHFGISDMHLVSQSRSQSLVVARSIAAWLCRIRLRMSYQELAIAFNRRDHTTMMLAVDRIEHGLQAHDERLSRDLCAVESLLAKEEDGCQS